MSAIATTKRRILIVEDGTSEREALARMLRLEKFDVSTARNVADALTYIGEPIDLILSDFRMGSQSGIDLLRAWHERNPHTPFVLLTAFGAIDTAVQAMKLGASDFLTKPVDPASLLQLIGDLIVDDSNAASSEPTRIINEGFAVQRIVGRSQAMMQVCEQTLRAARTTSTVLILGESGTGKELFAEAIHRHSPRAQGPFVVVNMAAIPDTLVESELFGHIKGSFTGASSDRVGRFESAHGGTLFIDEIGDFPLALQAKLLRALESRSVTPVGSDTGKHVDVRVVAATSRPLAQMKDTGAFRDDLYYRLNVIALRLPSLRERRQDIRLLVRHFLTETAREMNRRPLTVSPELMRELERLDWPGNVRQLRNCLERMTAMAHGSVLTMADLPPDLKETDGKVSIDSHGRMESIKRSAMMQALEQFGGNRTRAADFLGISVRTLQRKLREWDLNHSNSE